MISVQHLHTFQLRANAKLISHISNVADLAQLKGKENGKDFIILGEGSNTIFVADFLGEVVKLDLLGKYIEEGETDYLVHCAASENWHQFVVWLLEKGVFGLENLALIPGTVGASPIQNIGAYGVEVKQFIDQVHYFDLTSGTESVLTNNECQFGYRDSIFKHALQASAVITKVIFRIPKQWQPVCTYGELAQLKNPTADDIFNKVVEVRQAKLPDPSQLGNAGSFFKNPIVSKAIADTIASNNPNAPMYPAGDGKLKLAAGWLIDQCGLKGVEELGVAVHDKQALVLVNKSGEADGTGLLAMIDKVRSKVFEKFAVTLETEVRLIGKEGEVKTKLEADE